MLGLLAGKKGQMVSDKHNKGWCYTEDVIRATEKALDSALWDGLDTTYLERELAGLRLALSLGQQYQTEW